MPHRQSVKRRKGPRRRTTTIRKSNVTAVILLPKRTATLLARRRSGADVANAAQVKNDIHKVLKVARKEPIPKILKDRVEGHIHTLTKDHDANLQLFKAVAAFMFKDPHFAAMVEQRYGIVIGKGLTI